MQCKLLDILLPLFMSYGSLASHPAPPRRNKGIKILKRNCQVLRQYAKQRFPLDLVVCHNWLIRMMCLLLPCLFTKEKNIPCWKNLMNGHLENISCWNFLGTDNLRQLSILKKISITLSKESSLMLQVFKNKNQRLWLIDGDHMDGSNGRI